MPLLKLVLYVYYGVNVYRYLSFKYEVVHNNVWLVLVGIPLAPRFRHRNHAGPSVRVSD